MQKFGAMKKLDGTAGAPGLIIEPWQSRRAGWPLPPPPGWLCYIRDGRRIGSGARLLQKPAEIFLFPPPGSRISAVLPLAPNEFLGVNAAPAVGKHLVRNHRVQHLVEKNVTQKPGRNEGLIELRINPDDA